MANILGARERPIATRLLHISDVLDLYRDNADAWTGLLKGLRSTTSGVLRTQSGQRVEFEAREFLVITLPFVLPTIDMFATQINGFQQSADGAIKDLYQQLTMLQIETIQKPEDKALFLLLARLAEDRSIFDA